MRKYARPSTALARSEAPDSLESPSACERASSYDASAPDVRGFLLDSTDHEEAPSEVGLALAIGARFARDLPPHRQGLDVHRKRLGLRPDLGRQFRQFLVRPAQRDARPAVILTCQQGLELAVEVSGAQQPAAQFLEPVLPQRKSSLTPV